MKSGKKGRFFAFFALALLVASPFVFAGFGDWWSEFTGKAISGTATVNVTVGNNNPNVHFVDAISGQNPSEGTVTTLTFRWNVTDVDGVSLLDDSTAEGNFTFVGAAGTIRNNASCINTGQDLNSTEREYECTISLAYYDPDGTWNVNVSIQDQSGGSGQNVSTTFTYSELNAMVILQNTLNWSSVGTSDVNTTADNNITVNNTGNVASQGINITAYDLRGEITTTLFIGANNFSAGPTNDNGACITENTFVNWTEAANETIVTGTAVNRGTGAAGTEEVFFCITQIPPYATAQGYSSSYLAPWTIESTT